MRQYDPNPGLSAFAVVIGAVAGIAVGVILGFSGIGVALTAVVGILFAGVLASSFGIVGDRDRGRRSNDDLPSHYDDY